MEKIMNALEVFKTQRFSLDIAVCGLEKQYPGPGHDH